MVKIVAVVGAETIPSDVRTLLLGVGQKIAEAGAAVRSGFREGTEEAFYEGFLNGSPDPGNVLFKNYVPTPDYRFVDTPSIPKLGVWVHPPTDLPAQTAFAAEKVMEVFPFPVDFDSGILAEHGLNAFKMLGDDLQTPAHQVIAYIESDISMWDLPIGPQFIMSRIAWLRKIPISNLYDSTVRQNFQDWIDGTGPFA